MRRWAVAALWAAFAVSLHGHDLGRSESVVTVHAADVHVRLMFDLLELGGVDGNGDGAVSYGELDREIDRIYPAIKAHLVLTSPAAPTRVSLERYTVQDGHIASFDLLFTFASDVTRLTIHSSLHELLLPAHEHIVNVSFGGASSATILDAATPEKTFNAPRPRFLSLRQAAIDVLIVIAAAAGFYVLGRRKRGTA